MEKLQNYSTNAFKKTEEAELKALNSLKKAREEFGSLNNQSALLALAYPSEAAAISEKQLALKKAMPYLEQAQKDLSCYLDCDDTFFYVNGLCDKILNQTNDLKDVIHSMNEIYRVLDNLIDMVNFNLSTIKGENTQCISKNGF